MTSGVRPKEGSASSRSWHIKNQMRSDYFRMPTQGGAPTGCYPFMSPQFVGPTPAGYPYRDVVLLPPQTDVAEVRRMHPNATLIPLCEPPRFSSGFGIPFTDWNAMPTGPMFLNWVMGDLPDPNHGAKNQKPTSRDWAFEDIDPAFDNYDYADDVVNFERDDRDMARALATKGPGEENATGGKTNDEKED